MALTEDYVIAPVRLLLFDDAKTRWPDTELRVWLNDGQRAIAMARIDACTATRTLTLVAGVKQTIPSDCWLLLDIIRNVPATSGSIGKAIRLCELEALTAQYQAWPIEASSLTIENYSYDERNPTVFYVYPPVANTAAVNVEAMLATVPTPTQNTSSPLSIGDMYAPILINYVLWRAFSKDSGTPQGIQRAQMYLTAYLAGVQQIGQNLMQSSPNTATEGGVYPKSTRSG